MSSSLGLQVQDVVNVTVTLSPPAAQQRNFGNLMIFGDSDVIDTTQRYRLYTSLTGISNDFGTSAPEYKAAVDFFSQNPQPSQVYIARWARTATAGRLYTGVFSASQQATLLTTLQAISNGAFTYSVNSTPHTLTGLNFAAANNLNGVASVLATATSGQATVVWNASTGQFIFESETTGTSSTISVLSSPGSGTDLSATLNGTTATGATTTSGIALETPLACFEILDNMTNVFYGATFAASVQPSTSDYLALSAYVLADTTSHVLGITTVDSNTLNSASTSDLAYQLAQGLYRRTFVQYSSSDPYAACSIFGRAFTVNFNANNTTITLKFKIEPGVVAETITENQAATLNVKNCNVFVNYNNSTAIIQQGVMCDGTFFDIIHGTDWLQNAVQNSVWNALYLSPTKIPQTDAGMTALMTAAETALAQGVTNGLLAPGIWTGPPFGQLSTGQSLPKGYYTYAPPIATQAISQRNARIAVPIQAAAKGAGAIHFANVAITFNP